MKKIHIIGIGGTGMSAIARLLQQRGFTVSGSDRVMTPMAELLHISGIPVRIGHIADNVTGVDAVLRSSAIPDDNPEVQAARAAGIPVLKRADILGDLIAGQKCIAVAGTHGKTTTTAMIAWLLHSLGLDPSFITGSPLQNHLGNASTGKGPDFVIEADEYDHMFHGLEPRIAVITNMEHDHPDCYPTWEDYRQAFVTFIQKIKPGGLLLVSAEDQNAAALAAERPRNTYARTYGLAPNGHYQAANLSTNVNGGLDFELRLNPPDGRSMSLGEFSLKVPGVHNVLNATAALAVVHELGHSMVAAGDALAEFTGTSRRFEILGEEKQITIVNDYAHHPTEIRATLAAARLRFPERRLWAVWQPHTYSRTMALQDEFASAFEQADEVVITDVYAAREQSRPFPAVSFIERMNHPHAYFIPDLASVSTYLLENLQPGDVMIVLSAGNADGIVYQVLNGLKNSTVPAR